MAQQVVTQLVDDIDGSEADETLEFAWEGAQYRIDLNEKNADKFRKAIAPFLTSAQRVGGRARRGAPKAKALALAPAPRVSDAAAVRAWAIESGFDVPARGRIPNEVREAYEAAAS